MSLRVWRNFDGISKKTIAKPCFFCFRRVCFVCLCVLSLPLLRRLPMLNYWHQALGIIGSTPDTCYHKSKQKRLFCVGRKAYWFICVNLSKHTTLYMQLEAYVLVNLPRCTAHSSDPITTSYSRGVTTQNQFTIRSHEASWCGLFSFGCMPLVKRQPLFFQTSNLQ